MRQATITETKSKLSALLDRVRHGETILITNRGRPVARLEPVLVEGPDGSDDRLARLERQGVIRRPLTTAPKALIARKFPRGSRSSGVLQALLDERRRGR